MRTGIGDKDEFLELISLSTGTKLLPGNKYCLNGSVVHNYYAEIMPRRSLLLWLYKNIATSDEPQLYAVKKLKRGGNLNYVHLNCGFTFLGLHAEMLQFFLVLNPNQ